MLFGIYPTRYIYASYVVLYCIIMWSRRPGFQTASGERSHISILFLLFLHFIFLTQCFREASKGGFVFRASCVCVYIPRPASARYATQAHTVRTNRQKNGIALCKRHSFHFTSTPLHSTPRALSFSQEKQVQIPRMDGSTSTHTTTKK